MSLSWDSFVVVVGFFFGGGGVMFKTIWDISAQEDK